jgi:putative transposase
MRYRRIYIRGGTYFFTLVTYKRNPILSTQNSIDLFTDAIRYTAKRMPFTIVAYVILPDHMHFIWTMPEDSCDYSTRWRLIKSHFTRAWCQDGSVSKSASRQKKGEQDVWQRRFWEHMIRDENDLSRHVEYIHYNPVKHALVNSPDEWSYSSFKDYVKDGLYPTNWCDFSNIWPGEGFME